MLKVKLIKNLRKSLRQGHPWLYRDAIEVSEPKAGTQMCKVLDVKNKFLAWGYYDANSVIAVRILSLKPKPPHISQLRERLKSRVQFRFDALDFEVTNCVRLLNGEGDLLPGLVCDLYNNVAVVQLDGLGPSQFWDLNEISQELLSHEGIDVVYHKPRKKEENSIGTWGDSALIAEPVSVLENALKFKVDIVFGQKTGFFLDQRDNRNYLKKWCKGKSVANLFSYTGGFSVYAGAGGAKSVTSVDISPRATELAQTNWKLNFSDERHQALSQDVFDFIEQDHNFDVMVVDPPSMAHSKEQKTSAVAKYIEFFSAAAKKVNPGGDLFLSSCSSRINFEDFYELVTMSLSHARLKGTVLRYSGQGFDHPFLHICPEQRYLKFMHLKLG